MQSLIVLLLNLNPFSIVCSHYGLVWKWEHYLTFDVDFLRDVDETKDWINEKNTALNNDNYGHDLASVQALQRKHEGLERDLAALGEKVGLQLEAFCMDCLNF